MEKRNRNVMILSILALVLVLVGVTYAYFSAQITGIESASTISLTAGRMSIVYTEGDENVTVSNIYPKEDAWVTKTFTLTAYNTTNEEMKYDIGLNVETNGFADGYLTYDLKVLENTKGVPVSEKSNIPINGTGKIKFGTGSFTNADGDKHTYELKIYFKDNGLDQNDAQGAVFNAKVYVSEYEPKRINIALNSDNSKEVEVVTSYDINKTNCLSYVSNWNMTSEQQETYCTGGTITFDGESVSIARDLNTDLKEELISNGVVENVEYTTEVRLLTGTEYVDGQYTYIYGQERSIFYNVVDPNKPPYPRGYGLVNLSEDGWSVYLTNPSSTEPVITELCESINDKPIVSMVGMFLNSNAVSIDLSSFDTSNVTDMEAMFAGSQATSLDLSTFNTQKTKNMKYMFRGSYVTSLDISSFDTSNVTNMENMFSSNQATSIDLSSFDTSKVTNMSYMFYNAFNLKTIYATNNFVTTTLNEDNSGYQYNGSYQMFTDAKKLVGGAGTTYDASKTNKAYAHIDGGVSNPGYFTNKNN